MATPVAHKESEAELFSLLKSANLLDYYNKFIEQGGDDIHQFCDATEEEFKEMVCLVGMSAKPLHVRRLQKCLVEWKAKKARRGDQTPEKSSSWIDGWTPNQSPNVPRTPTAIVTTPASNGSSRKRKASSGSAGKESTEKRVVELKLPPMDVIIDWEKLDSERQQLIREHSKIYGRDEKKRKSDTLNCHEQMINEAAAQLCLRDPTLLVRRDELFTMARRVVRESGFTYVHGHSRSKFIGPDSDELLPGKRPYQSQVNKYKRIERLSELDDLLQKNKELQDEVVRKIEEARALLNGAEVAECQTELSKLQEDQLTLKMEQKDLRKKQRRSDRYYSNKEIKDSDSGDGENADGEGQEGVQEGTGVPGGGVHEDVAFVDENEVANATHAHSQAMAVQQQQQPVAVVTEILQPAADNTASTTTVSEDESSVRAALYNAFMPSQLTEDQQQAAAAHAASIASFQAAAARGQVQGYAVGTAAITDPTINALLSLSAKDKTMVPGVPNMDGVGMTVPVTATSGTHSTVFSSPNITVVMPTGHTLPANMQGWR